jgi:peptidoglycan/LPS O-acetylase OafA/YrhL
MWFLVPYTIGIAVGGLCLLFSMMSFYENQTNMWPLFTFAWPLGVVVLIVKAVRLTINALKNAWNS